MNTKVFAILAALLVISGTSLARPDWLDDLTAGTGRLVQAVNENAEKVNQLTHNLDVLARALQKVDLDRSGEE